MYLLSVGVNGLEERADQEQNDWSFSGISRTDLTSVSIGYNS